MPIEPTQGVVLLVIGFFAGTLGTIVGAGGGFLFVPALLIYLRLPPAMAAGTGLAVVFINTLSGVIGFIRQQRIAYGLALRIVCGAIPGTFVGVWLAESASPEAFSSIFALVLIGLGLFLAVRKMPQPAAGASGAQATRHGAIPLYQLLAVGVLIGTVSSYFGIGGGWLLVPILVYGFGIRPYIATATVIFSLCINALVGALIYVSHASVVWPAVLWGGAGIMVGAQVGVYLSSRIPGRRIIQLLALVLVGVGLKLLMTDYGG